MNDAARDIDETPDQDDAAPGIETADAYEPAGGLRGYLVGYHSRGGRLAADIQAVVAADFIRNLREEVRKGFYGRLKQGIYPLAAPVGYLDCGGGKPKVIDPFLGPLVHEAFERYATGDYNFHTLRDEMYQRGLRNRAGKRVEVNALSRMLNNTFYFGVISLRSKECFDGLHEPLITKDLYDRVQLVLRGNRLAGAAWKHKFTFRKMIRCAHCGRSLIGERQKQRYTYYRCHDPACGGVCLSEKRVVERLGEVFAALRFQPDEIKDVREVIDDMGNTAVDSRAKQIKGLELRIDHIQARLSRLADLLVDETLDKSMYEEKKRELLFEQSKIREQISSIASQPSDHDRAREDLELADTAYLQYESANPDEIRKLVLNTTSNFMGERNSPVIRLKKPLQALYEYRVSQSSALVRDDHRTSVRKIAEIFYTGAVSGSAETQTLECPQPPEVQRRVDAAKPSSRNTASESSASREARP